MTSATMETFDGETGERMGRARKKQRRQSRIGTLGKVLLRHPGRVLVTCLVGGLGGAIAMNALVMQPERHPWPLFAHRQAPVRQEPSRAAPVTQPAVVPLPPRKAAAAEGTVSPVTAAVQAELTRRGFFVPGTSLASAVSDFQQTAGLKVDGQASEALLAALRSSKLTLKDQIEQLLQPAAADAGTVGNVALVQRALNKVGYGPLQEDGVLGAGTRAAIERFEREHHLPVMGEPQGRVLHALAVSSGIAVD